MQMMMMMVVVVVIFHAGHTIAPAFIFCMRPLYSNVLIRTISIAFTQEASCHVRPFYCINNFNVSYSSLA